MIDRDDGRSKSSLHEIAGGLGDLGVFIPLALALVIENGFNLKGIFLAAGIYYIVSGVFFKIPMPVQPLKAMAAIALASGLSQDVLQVAGLQFGIIILLLLIPGVSRILDKLFPLPVIRGIQLALGIILISMGLKMAWTDLPLACIAFLILLITYLLIKPIPTILTVLLMGLVISLLTVATGAPLPAGIRIGLSMPDMSLKNLIFPLSALVIPQMGLTIGNSMMATIQTSRDLFRDKSKKVTFKNLAISIGVGNILSPFIGGIPMCHGSGGLTAHYQFGARRHFATIFAGALFLFIALIPSGLIQPYLMAFPVPFLGVSLVIVGVFHGLLAKEALIRGKYAPAVIATALTSILLKNLTAGMAIGFLTFRLQGYIISLISAEKTF